MSEKRKLNIAMNYRIDEALFEAMSSYYIAQHIKLQNKSLFEICYWKSSM